MLSQAQLIYQQARDELPLGSPNVAGASAESIEKAEFLQSVCIQISKLFILPAYRQKTLTHREASILNQMCNALFAQTYQCAYCPEQASLVFVKSLELEIEQSKEQVQLTGTKYLKIELGYQNGNPIRRCYGSHNTTLLGRDAKKSDLQKVSTWNGITTIDTWGEGQVREYKTAKEHHNGVDLVNGFFEPQEVTCNIRVDGKLTTDEWNRYADLLIQLQAFINKNFQTWFTASKRTHTDAKGELAKINENFKRKIHLYKNFGNPFIIRHWRKNTVTLFKESGSSIDAAARSSSTIAPESTATISSPAASGSIA